MRTYKKNRKKRAKSSYTTYKQNIKALDKKGYTIDKNDILTKKQFEYVFSNLKARGKKNITRDLAKDLVSYQYQRYTKQLDVWKKKGYALYDRMTKEQFEDTYQEAKKVENLKARGIAYEIAEADLKFQPSFAKEYSNFLYEENQIENYEETYEEYPEEEIYGPLNFKVLERRYKKEIQKIENEIMQGKYEGKDLFEKYMLANDGYYYDEQGARHIKKNIREQYEALY